MTRPSPRRRRGFTMVELLVVVVIIAILVALLLPAVFNAVSRAREAAVVSDINSLGQSLEAFKNQYNEYPPSRILLMENGFYNTADTTLLTAHKNFFGTNKVGGSFQPSATDLTYGQLAERSVRYLRKFFPRAQYSTSAILYKNTTTGWHDFNGNGTLDNVPILLEGHECLVFFLGGIPNHTGDVVSLDGFATNPVNPFVSTVINASAPRNKAFYEFQTNRLLDEDQDGIPGYLDSMDTSSDPRPYVYFSAYGQNGYDPNDANFQEADTSGTITSASRAFRVNFAVTNPFDSSTPLPGSVSSAAPNPYTTSQAYVSTVNFAAAFHKPNSYQIIAAGRDRNYGIGGQYLTSGSGERLPFPDVNTDQGGNILDIGYRTKVEGDNLANIASTRLE